MPCSACNGTGKQKCITWGGKVHIIMTSVDPVEEMDILLALDKMVVSNSLNIYNLDLNETLKILNDN